MPLEEVCEIYAPHESAAPIANAIRAYALSFAQLVKPIAIIVKEGLISHIDNVSEELYLIQKNLCKLTYNIEVGYESLVKRNYTFSGTVTNKNIHQFIEGAIPAPDDVKEEVIMTVIGDNNIELSIIFLCANGIRSVEENLAQIEDEAIFDDSMGQLKVFSSYHVEDYKIAFTINRYENYYSIIKFSSNRRHLLENAIRTFKQLVQTFLPDNQSS